MPGHVASHHGIEDCEKLAHASGEGNLLGLSGSAQALIEMSDHRIMTGGYKSRHIESSSHPCTSSPDGALAAEGTAVTVERRHAYQGGYFSAVECPKFGQLGQEGNRHYLAYSWNTSKQVVLLLPEGAFLNLLLEVTVDVGQAFLQPGYVFLNVLPDVSVSSSEAILLGYKHSYQLAPPTQYGAKFLSLGIGQWTRLRMYRCREMRQYASIKDVSLGQFAGGLGKVSHLAGVDHRYWYCCHCQCGYQGQLNAPGGFQGHQSRSQFSQVGNSLVNSTLIVSKASVFSGYMYAYIHSVLSNINACVDLIFFHFLLSRFSFFVPSLHDAGLANPGNCSGSTGIGAATQLWNGLQRPRGERSTAPYSYHTTTCSRYKGLCPFGRGVWASFLQE